MAECAQCGAGFDPAREPDVPGGDPLRCPKCGHKHAADDVPDAPTVETTDDTPDGVTIEVHIHE